MRYLNEAQHDLVSTAVREAEAHTSGEIVTVLADKSDGYSDVALWWAIAISFSAMAVVTAAPQFFTAMIDAVLGGWGTEWTPGTLLSLATGIGLVKFIFVWALMAWLPLRFLVIPFPIKASRVRHAAVKHFKVGAERRTHGRTGVLLYLSMREHRAEIVADEAIAARVDAAVWGEAMADMLAEIRKGRIAEGLVAGIHDVGNVLSEHFPRAEDDRNELPDRLIEV